MITLNARILVAGHRGLVGSALVRRLSQDGQRTLLLPTHAELDLRDADATLRYFRHAQPDHVFMAAAVVGGIQANASEPWRFIHDNLAIATSVIGAAQRQGVQRLLFLGSSCIYPRIAPQPITESDLLTGPLEPTNRPYALAKIAGIELCWSSNRQHRTRFLAAMPCNLYGEGDNYHPEHSHVIPGLLRRFHEARQRGDAEVTVWGSGEPRREFLHSDDMADACVHLMGLPDARFDRLLGGDPLDNSRLEPPLINIGSGQDITIADLATQVALTVGYDGRIVFDRSKPDGTPRKLMNVRLIASTGWKAGTPLQRGLQQAYAEFVASQS